MSSKHDVTFQGVLASRKRKIAGASDLKRIDESPPPRRHLPGHDAMVVMPRALHALQNDQMRIGSRHQKPAKASPVFAAQGRVWHAPHQAEKEAESLAEVFGGFTGLPPAMIAEVTPHAGEKRSALREVKMVHPVEKRPGFRQVFQHFHLTIPQRLATHAERNRVSAELEDIASLPAKFRSASGALQPPLPCSLSHSLLSKAGWKNISANGNTHRSATGTFSTVNARLLEGSVFA